MNNHPIYGNIVCCNELPDIQRLLDSLSGITDKIYIVDSGSTDGTWEWLGKVREVYGLVLFQNPWESFLAQRQWLLDQTPYPSWVISLDADEAFNLMGTMNLRNALHSIDDRLIKKNRQRYVIAPEVDYYQLKDDIRHRIEYKDKRACKIFFYDENVRWKNKSHCELQPKHLPDTQNGLLLLGLIPSIAIKHHAFLDKEKMTKRESRIKDDPTVGQYEYDFYYKVNHKVVPLERELW